MKYIVTQKQEKIAVDDELYDDLNQYQWYIHQGYACRSVQTEKGSRKLRMHRQILGLEWGKQGSNTEVVDHIDRDKLNNTKGNLRLCTKQENEWNRAIYSNNTTGYTGVRLTKNKENPYQAVIKIDNITRCLGSFTTAEKAYIAYLEAKIIYQLKGSID